MEAEHRESTRLTGYHWIVLTVAWLGWVFDIFDTALFNLAKGPMLKEILPVGANQAAIEGLLQMVFLGGWAVGGLVFGILADRWGRTRTLTLTILIYCAFTGLTALCQTWEQVAAIRFLTALGLGGEWAAGAALIAEVFPNRFRPLAAALLQTAAAFGPVFAALANLRVAAADWRVLFLIGIAPAVLTVFVRVLVKEPERWREAASRAKGSMLEPLRVLFADPRWRRNVIVATVIGAVGVAGAGNAAYWHPNLVEALSGGAGPDVIQARKSYALMTFHVGTLMGVLIVPWLCHMLGRRLTLAAFFVGAPLTTLGVARIGSYEWFLWLGPLMAFFSIGVSAAFVLYFTELFPTAIRATGSGFAYNVARVISMPFPWITGLLIGSAAATASKAEPGKGVLVGVSQAAIIYAIGLVALLFAPETKGKPLPDD